MAKEFKQRTIKNNNKKYITLSISIAIIIAIIVLIIVLIHKKTKDDTAQNNENLVQMGDLTQKNNPIQDEQELEINLSGINNNTPEVDKNEIQYIDYFRLEDASINGVERNMSEDSVKKLLGIPESTYKEQSILGDEMLIYTYNSGKTKVYFILTPNHQSYMVHRIQTTSKDVTLCRKIRIGGSADVVLSAFPEENILCKEDNLIVIGNYGEDPMYATSLQPKIYFTIKNNIITEVLISIGNEN